MGIPVTLKDQVSEVKKLDISYRILNNHAVITNDATNTKITVPFLSLTNKYRNFLSTIVKTVTLSDDEYADYRFRPKTISYDLYGTTEFWNDILILNKCFSVSDFDTKVIKVYDPGKLKSLINEILILEDVR